MDSEINYTKIQVVFRDMNAVTISEDELVIYKLSGEYHRIDYLNAENQPHRLDGPACEWTDGWTGWYNNGLCSKMVYNGSIRFERKN